MSDYRKMGHAMRRRAGAASNHVDGAEKKTSVDMPDNLQSMIAGGSARIAVGAVVGKLMPKKNTQAGDPTIMNKANRQNVEYKGAQHRITARMPAPINSEAGATMANARIVPSVMGRQAPNFNSGVDSNY